MKRFSLLILTWISGLFILCCNPALADSDPQSLLTKVRQHAGSVQSFSCNFIQEKHLSLFPKPVLFRGNLKLVRPDKLRWSFVSPIPSTLILNSHTGIRCIDDNQTIRFSLDDDPVMRIVATQLWSWMNGDYEKLSNQYNLKKTAETTLQINPIGKAHWQGIVTITFDKKTFHPQRIIITEPEGDYTRIEFSEYRLNSSHPPSTFTSCQ